MGYTSAIEEMDLDICRRTTLREYPRVAVCQGVWKEVKRRVVRVFGRDKERRIREDGATHVCAFSPEDWAICRQCSDHPTCEPGGRAINPITSTRAKAVKAGVRRCKHKLKFPTFTLSISSLSRTIYGHVQFKPYHNIFVVRLTNSSFPLEQFDYKESLFAF